MKYRRPSLLLGPLLACWFPSLAAAAVEVSLQPSAGFVSTSLRYDGPAAPRSPSGPGHVRFDGRMAGAAVDVGLSVAYRTTSGLTAGVMGSWLRAPSTSMARLDLNEMRTFTLVRLGGFTAYQPLAALPVQLLAGVEMGWAQTEATVPAIVGIVDIPTSMRGVTGRAAIIYSPALTGHLAAHVAVQGLIGRLVSGHLRAVPVGGLFTAGLTWR